MASTPYYRGFGLPGVVVNHKATEESGLLGYDAVVLGGFRHCEGRGDSIFKSQDGWKMMFVEDDN